MIFVFYDKFYLLCQRLNVTPNKACIDMGLSRSVAAKWKHSNATPTAETLAKIAAYFGVTVDFLLEDSKNDSVSNLPDNTNKKLRSISRLEEIDITEEEEKQINSFLDFVLSKRGGNKEK